MILKYSWPRLVFALAPFDGSIGKDCLILPVIGYDDQLIPEFAELRGFPTISR